MAGHSDAKQVSVFGSNAPSGRRAIVLAALPGIIVTAGIALTERFSDESWSALPFLLSGAAAVHALRMGDRYVKMYEQAIAAGTRRRVFDGRLMPTGRRYLAFHAQRAGWSASWSVGLVWAAWAVPVGLVVYLAASILVDLLSVSIG